MRALNLVITGLRRTSHHLIKNHQKNMLMKKERFDCKTARNIPIESILSRIGLFPKRNLEKEAWYLSPFLSESKASFKVSKVLDCSIHYSGYEDLNDYLVNLKK